LDPFAKEFGLARVEGKQKIAGQLTGTTWTPKWELLLNLKDGELCEAIPQGILAYTKAWEIMIADADTLRMVVKGA
jgi:hypothetical protein